MPACRHGQDVRAPLWGTMLNHLRGVVEEPSKVIVWLYYGWRYLAARLTGRGSGSALFTPERPLMGYAVWRMCRELGLRIASEPADDCRVALNWEDATVNAALPPALPTGIRFLNARCIDIRKSTVEAASIAAFGYGLGLDPRTHVGPFVRKSEENALHDGAVLHGPLAPESGHVDQRLLDNVVEGLAEDLRISIVGRQIPVVIRRRFFLSARFDKVSNADLVASEGVFDDDEVEQLLAFSRHIGLDYGDLDVIRDRGDGRIYVVDANKTPGGPPIQLGFRFGVRVHRLLAQAFDEEFLARRAPGWTGEATE
jgi:hypothetical protein